MCVLIIPLQTNTFQCILATNGSLSYAIFLYEDNGIQWTAADGQLGGEGTPALAGFNLGDGIESFTLPGSLSGSIMEVSNSSNVGRSGAWVFRVDTTAILQPGGEELEVYV